MAWAHEGIARVHMRKGELTLALEQYDRAMRIRTQLQESADGKELFNKELSELQRTMEELRTRQLRRQQVQRAGKKAVALARLSSSFQASEALAPDRSRTHSASSDGNEGLQTRSLSRSMQLPSTEGALQLIKSLSRSLSRSDKL